MRFTASKTTGILRAWNDDKTKCFAIAGTIKALLEARILLECDADPDRWLIVPQDLDKPEQRGNTYSSKEECKAAMQKLFG